MSNQIELLAYPEVLDLESVPEIGGKLSYIIRGYRLDGLSVLISDEGNIISIKFGDWNGNLMDVGQPNKSVRLFLSKYFKSISKLMRHARIPKAILYLSEIDDKLIMVDFRTSLNKFAGPGMLRDLFQHIIPIQETVKVATLDNNLMGTIKEGKDDFGGPIIIKTSAFKTIERQNPKRLLPLYAKIRCKDMAK